MVDIHKAALEGSLETVQSCLINNPDIDVRDGDNNTALHWASYAGNYEVVRYLLDNGADANALGCFNNTPVLFASNCDSDNAQVVHLLAQMGANVNHVSDKDPVHQVRPAFNTTALLSCCRWSTLSTLIALIEEGADVTMTNGAGDLPIHLAANRGEMTILRFLLENKVNDINAVGFCGRTPIMKPAEDDADRSEQVRLLAQYGADVNFRSPDPRPLYQDTAVLLCCQLGSLSTLKTLAEVGADLKAQSRNGNLPIHEAVLSGKHEIVEYLTSYNDVDAFGSRGRTPLMCAAVCNVDQSATVRALVRAGAGVDHVDPTDGISPLHLACQCSHPATVAALLAAGADLWRKALDGRLPTDWAMDANRQDVIDRILAFVYKDNNDLPLHQACANGLVRNLRDSLRDYEVDQQDELLLNTPLHICVYKNARKCAEVLLGEGASVERCNLAGMTAVGVAAGGCDQWKQHHSSMVHLLTTHSLRPLQSQSHVTSNITSPNIAEVVVQHKKDIRKITNPFKRFFNKKSSKKESNMNEDGHRHRQEILMLKADGYSYEAKGYATTKKDAQTNAAKDFIQFLIKYNQMTQAEASNLELTIAPEESDMKEIAANRTEKSPTSYIQSGAIGGSPPPMAKTTIVGSWTPYQRAQSQDSPNASYIQSGAIGGSPAPAKSTSGGSSTPYQRALSQDSPNVLAKVNRKDREDVQDFTVNPHGNWTLENAKDGMNKFLQMNKIKADYEYTTEGPDNNRTFTAEMTIFVKKLNRNIVGCGRGSKKLIASKECALSLLKQLSDLGLIQSDPKTKQEDETQPDIAPEQLAQVSFSQVRERGDVPAYIRLQSSIDHLPPSDIEVLQCTVDQYNDNVSRSKHNYQLRRNPRGFAIIVNMMKYDDESKNRTRRGSDMDVSRMCALFSQLHFRVCCYLNLDASSVENVLHSLTHAPEIYYDDAFVLVLMGHGHEGYITARDGAPIAIDEIIKRFNNMGCPPLKRKPKVILVQACRGDREDYGVLLEERDSEMERNYTPKVATDADTLVAYASQYGYAAYRHAEQGSWFIGTLAQVFSKNANKYHILELMTQVIKIISEDKEDDGKKSVPDVITRLTKDLYFHPGLISGNNGDSDETMLKG